MLLLVSTPSFAQTKSDTAAQAVFQQGLAKYESGDFASACPLLQRAIDLSSSPAIGGMLTLADCLEKTDRPASAWGLYGKALAAARAEGQTERADKARKAVERLEPTLPRVHFVWRSTTAKPAGLQVAFAGESIPADAWDVAIPVDPGTTRFSFSAEGSKKGTRTTEIPRGPGTTEVEVPDLAASETSSSSASVPVTPPAPLHGDRQPPRAMGGLGVAGAVVGAVGVIGIGVSVGLILDAKSKWKAAVTRDCGGHLDRCSSLEGIDSARHQGNGASVAFGVGLGVAAVGTTMLIVDLATRHEHPYAASSHPVITAGVAPDGKGGGAGFASARWSTW